MTHEVFLDHFQTEQFGLYWRHYPKVGLNAGLFATCEELVEIFSDTKAIDAIRLKITSLAERVATRSELADAIKMEYEVVNQRLGMSDWIFTGVGLALDWVPLPGVGVASTLVEKGVNYLVQKNYGWLLFMNKLNSRLRESE